MTYYFVYTFLLLMDAIARFERKFRPLLYWSALFGLYIFSGFRYEVGCDWIGYINQYKLMAAMESSRALWFLDPGQSLLIVTLQWLGLPYPYLNVVTSALFFIGLHALAKRQPNPLAFIVLAFPILIINMPMAAIRQGAAIGFLCLAFTSFLDRRTIRYILFIILGSLFHFSILIFLTPAPFVKRDISFRAIAWVLCLAIPLFAALFTVDAAQQAVNTYVGTSREAFGAAFRLGVVGLTGLAFLLFFRQRWRYYFPGDYKLVWINALGMVLALALLPISSVIGDRIGYYLIPVQLMIFARLPYLYPGRLRQVVSVLPYAALTLVFLVWTISSYHFKLCYLPYRMFVFQEDPVYNYQQVLGQISEKREGL